MHPLQKLIDWLDPIHDSVKQKCIELMEEEKSTIPATGKNKPFIVANVRDILDKYELPENDVEGISFSRMVELFNEVAENFYSNIPNQKAC